MSKILRKTFRHFLNSPHTHVKSTHGCEIVWAHLSYHACRWWYSQGWDVWRKRMSHTSLPPSSLECGAAKTETDRGHSRVYLMQLSSLSVRKTHAGVGSSPVCLCFRCPIEERMGRRAFARPVRSMLTRGEVILPLTNQGGEWRFSRC